MTVRELLTKWKIVVDQKDLNKLDRKIRQAKRSFKAAGEEASKAFKIIKTSVKAASIAILAASAAIGVFLQKAGQFEQAQIAFETMLGSATKAAKLLQDITDFAAKTPFQLTGLIESSKRVLAFGFSMEEVLPTLNTLGNIAAGVGRDKLPRLVLALGQVRAATRLRGQELRQFTEAGVPLLEELAKAQGKTEAQITDMIRAGKIGFKDVNQALVNLTSSGGRFFQLMVKQSKSFLGVISNIIDALEVTAIRIGQQLLPDAKKLAITFLDFLTVNRKLIAVKVGEFFKNLVEFVGDLVFVLGRLGKLLKTIADLFGGVNKVLSFTLQLFVFLTSASLLFGLGRLIQIIFKLTKAIRKLGIVALITQAIGLFIPILIGAAFIALLAAIEDVLAFIRGEISLTGRFVGEFNKLVDDLSESWKKLGEFARKVLTDLLLPLRALFNGIDTISEALAAAFEGDFTGVFKALAKGIAETFDPRNIEDFGAALGFDPEERTFRLKGADPKVIREENVRRRREIRQAAIPPSIARPPSIRARAGIFPERTPTFTRIVTPAPAAGVTPAPTQVTNGGNTISININAPITVPAGTRPEVAGEALRKAANEVFSEALRNTRRTLQPEVAF